MYNKEIMIGFFPKLYYFKKIGICNYKYINPGK